MLSIHVGHLRRHSADEWRAEMELRYRDRADIGPMVGERIVERFGRPQILRGNLLDEDLNPEYRRQHRGSARHVLKQITTGRPGEFVVDRRGRFLDHHGGNGLRGANGCVEWFTPESLRRGIGWFFIQTYVHDGVRLARFKVTRIFYAGNPYRLEVRKVPLR